MPNRLPPSPLSRQTARQLDTQDTLAPLRKNFVITDPHLAYLDGNSLGRLPRRTAEVLREAVDHQWGERLVRSWGEHWLTLPLSVGDKIGGLTGAAPGQIAVTDSTSINLYKLVSAALSLRPDRAEVLTDTLNFPSDIYILQGCVQAAAPARTLRLVPINEAAGEDPTQAILSAITEQTALVVLSHVVFKSGGLYDAAAVTRRAHELGALVLWDLSHSVGAVPIHLDGWDVDFAVGCTYKYLNGGPGAPAFLYVRRDLQAQVVSPVWGWFGQQLPFAFDLTYQPAEGIRRFLCGSPGVLGLLAVECGVDLLAQAGIEALRQKSTAQTAYLIELFDGLLAPLGFSLGTPRDPARRGSHITIRHPHGYQINRALIEEQAVIPDFREPDNIRLGIAPIYTRYVDIWDTVDRIRQVVQAETYRAYPADRASVT